MISACLRVTCVRLAANQDYYARPIKPRKPNSQFDSVN